MKRRASLDGAPVRLRHLAAILDRLEQRDQRVPSTTQAEFDSLMVAYRNTQSPPQRELFQEGV